MSPLVRWCLAITACLSLSFASLGVTSGRAVAAGTTHFVSTALLAVLDTSCSEPGFNSIQAAVTASNAGDTIIVCDGVYGEQVTIAKSLTLAGSGNAVINAPPTPTTQGDLVTISGGLVSVRMSGFVVSGPGPSSCGSIQAGIRVTDDATLDLSNTEIRDIRDEPFSGCQNGEAIRIGPRGGSGGPGHATIDNVIAVGYQKNGITVNGDGSTANIMNVTTRGFGPTTVIAQNGIQISRGAAGTISTSTVRDHDYTPGGTVACGLLIFQANGVNDDSNIYLANEKDKCTFGGRGGTFEGMP